MWYKDIKKEISDRIKSVCKLYKLKMILRDPSVRGPKYTIGLSVINESQNPFTRRGVILIQRDIKRYTQDLENDFKISLSSCRYTAFEFSLKILIEQKIQRSKDDEKILSQKIGFTQNILGMKFSHKNEEYEISDIRLKNYKYPVIVKRKDGALYKYPVTLIKNSLGGDKIINRNANLDSLLEDL